MAIQSVSRRQRMMRVSAGSCGANLLGADRDFLRARSRFSIGCGATGENIMVLVARDLENGALVGVACRSEREVYVNAAPARLGYLGQFGSIVVIADDGWSRAAIAAQRLHQGIRCRDIWRP